MRVMSLSQRHQISESDQQHFGFTELQSYFLEEYLSNGMKITDAARQAMLSINQKYAKESNAYFSARGAKFLASPTVSAYLAKYLKKAKAASVNEVLDVISSILHDEEAENKDRLKAGELLLKHHNAFDKHQQARANKSLTLNSIGALSDKELEKELQKRLSQLSDIKHTDLITEAQIEIEQDED
jgi:hypothetical protein